MLKKMIILPVFIWQGMAAFTQPVPGDSIASTPRIIPASDTIPLLDTSINYDELLTDFDAFMDSILSPRSYFLTSLSIGKSYYNFETKNTAGVMSIKKFTYSPTLGYYSKSGLGLTGTGYVVNDNRNLNLYQFALTPSFDYLQDRSLATGISYTKFFTKDSLPFYTTPLQNELYAYFIYRRWWLKPSVALSYGWGSRTDYTARESIIQDLRLRRRGFTYVNTEETVSDFSIAASVRHDFYWLDLFTQRDHIRFTPQVTFTSGTQKFGFNQSSSTFATILRTGNNVLFNSENVYLDDEIHFQPLSLTLYLRGEYSIGRFFIQPQFIMDYYFPATTKNFTSLLSLNMGFIF